MGDLSWIRWIDPWRMLVNRRSAARRPTTSGRRRDPARRRTATRPPGGGQLHACLIVRSDHEAWTHILPFADDARRGGQRVVYIGDETRLMTAGSQLSRAGRRWRRFTGPGPSLPNRRDHDVIWVLRGAYGPAAIRRAASAIAAAGQRPLSLILDVQPDRHATPELVEEHEAGLAHLADASSSVAAIICVYDAAVVDLTTILAASASHPHVVGSRPERVPTAVSSVPSLT
jgi:hypothetical protein